MNGVQNHRMRVATAVIDRDFDRLNLFLDVILNDFYSLNNYVFEKSLPLLKTNRVTILILLKFLIYFLLKLKVHSML